MLKFLKGLAKNVLTLVLGYVALLVLGVIVVAVMLAGLEQPERPIVQDSVLVIDLNASISDAPLSEGAGALVGSALGGRILPSFNLLEMLNAIETGADDPRIAGIYIHGSLPPNGYGIGMATVRELRDVLGQFRERGKPVIAFLDQPRLLDYYLVSVADRIALSPFSFLAMKGLVAETPFFANALDKYGVGVQVVRAGTFKSAIEPFVRTEMSEANREQLTALIGDLWTRVLTDIATARGLDFATIRGGGQAGSGIYDADAALDAGLVDRIAYRDEVFAEIEVLAAYDSDLDAFAQVGLRRYIEDTRAPTVWEDDNGAPQVAVIYAEGDIVDGDGSSDTIGGAWMARKLRDLRNDPQVAAAVLRVNSPGGSATASEEIHRELTLLAETIPVVVSFGNIAASGGYWIASPAQTVFAEPVSITGSIGVFGLLFNIEELAGGLGVNFDRVVTDPFADIETITRPKSEAEMELIQDFVDTIYGAFLDRVAAGRKLDREAVDAMAQGRVYTGQQAADLGLIDQSGGLKDAIAHAARQADLGDDWVVRQVPERLTTMESLALLLSPQSDPPATRSLELEELSLLAELRAGLALVRSDTTVYARLPFELLIR